MGSVVTSVLFNLGKIAIGLYIGKNDFSTSYGAAGSLVILLIWIFYSAQILLIGAEFTKVYSRNQRKSGTPSHHVLPDQEVRQC